MQGFGTLQFGPPWPGRDYVSIAFKVRFLRSDLPEELDPLSSPGAGEDAWKTKGASTEFTHDLPSPGSSLLQQQVSAKSLLFRPPLSYSSSYYY